MSSRIHVALVLCAAPALAGCPLFWLGPVACNGPENCPDEELCVEGRCRKGGGDVPGDGGVSTDGGAPSDAGGVTGSDAGVVEDAGQTGGDDAGQSDDDAGVVVPDAGEPFDLHFAQIVGGLQFDQGKAVASFADGSVVVVGNLGGDATIGAGAGGFPIAGGVDDVPFIARIGADGVAVWAKTIGDSAWEEGNAVALSADESTVFFGGEITGGSLFDPGGPAETTITGNGARDGVLVALDADTGALRWYQVIGGAVDHDSIYGLAYSAVDDAIVAVGVFHATSSFDRLGAGHDETAYDENGDVFVAKYGAADGALAWVRTGSCGCGAGALAVHEDGRVTTGGALSGFLRLPDEPEPLVFPVSGSATRLWVASFDVSGAFEWVYVEPSTDYSWASALSFFADGSLVVAGGRNPDNVIGEERTLLIGLDASGEEAWRRASTAGGAADVAVLADGGFLTLEFSRFDVTHGSITADAIGDGDGFIARYDAARTPSFVKAFGGSDYEYPHSLSYRAGNVAFTGDFRGPITVYGVELSPIQGAAVVVSLQLRD